MAKLPKWRINIAHQSFFTVETQAATEKIAMEMAMHQIEKDPNYFATGSASVVTGVFINDREARDFHPYVPESMPSEKAN